MEQAYLDNLKREFDEQGYTVARGLYSADEAATYRDHFMALRAQGPHPGDMAGFDTTDNDPLLRYPRMIHMHRWDELSRDWLLSDRHRTVLSTLLGSEPIAFQSMMYFKPAGARGQALHQDNHFLRVQPGTCVATWMALDDCNEENGCLEVVPGSHDLPVLCHEQADTTKSFTDEGVRLPEGMEAVPVPMQPGDVLLFNGALIHGSSPNTSTDRFRRSLIGHYASQDSVKCADYYFPVLNMDGQEVTLEDSPGGGPCGKWVTMDGTPRVEFA